MIKTTRNWENRSLSIPNPTQNPCITYSIKTLKKGFNDQAGYTGTESSQLNPFKKSPSRHLLKTCQFIENSKTLNTIIEVEKRKNKYEFQD